MLFSSALGILPQQSVGGMFGHIMKGQLASSAKYRSSRLTLEYVNGSCAWVIAREEIGNDSCAKDGTLISSRPTMSTNVFEKANGEWRMVSHHAQEILSV